MVVWLSNHYELKEKLLANPDVHPEKVLYDFVGTSR
jgi:predicted esterase YcpF (UPF0227 family)